MACSDCERKIGNAVAEFVAANFKIRPIKQRIAIRMKRPTKFYYKATGNIKTIWDAVVQQNALPL